MPVYVDGRRVITSAPGAIVKSKSLNYTCPKKTSTAIYDNFCRSEDLVNCCEDVLIDGFPVATLDSFFPKSYGDELGLGGGVSSGTINGKAIFITASESAFVSSYDGKTIVDRPVIREGDLVISNSGNCNPAPIQFIDNYCVDNSASKNTSEQNQPKTNYQSRIVVHTGGKEPLLSCLIVGCYCVDTNVQYQYLPIHATWEDDNTSKSYRIILKNIPAINLSHGLWQYQQDGETLELPLLKSQNISRDKQETLPSHLNEDEQLVALRLVNDYQLPIAPLNEVSKNDYSDIFRLSDQVRHKIYSFLINYKLTKAASLLDKESSESIQYSNWVENSEQIPLLSDFEKNWYQLIPPSLKVMVDMELNMKVIRSLDDGWLYVYVNGHLWRELEIKHGLLHDVNLKTHGQKDSRKAQGQAEQKLIVPYKISGKYCEVELAFSQHQWSWSRLNFFGGISEECNDIVSNKEILYSERRARRFCKLKLKSLIKNDQEYINGENNKLQLFQSAGHYHCILNNSFRPIDVAVRDLLFLQKELLQYIEGIQSKTDNPYFKSALITYHYFFHPTHGWRTKSLASRNKQNAFSLQMSFDDVCNVLKSHKRRRYRDLIRALQLSLVAILEIDSFHPITEIQPLLNRQQRCYWYQVLEDWFAGGVANYSAAWATVGMISSSICFEPSFLDHAFEHEFEVDLQEPTVGEQYLLLTLEDAYPLYKVIQPASFSLKQEEKLDSSCHFEEVFDNYQCDGEVKFNQCLYSYFQSGSLEISKGVVEAFQGGYQSYSTNLIKALIKKGKASRKSMASFINNHSAAAMNKQLPEFRWATEHDESCDTDINESLIVSPISSNDISSYGAVNILFDGKDNLLAINGIYKRSKTTYVDLSQYDLAVRNSLSTSNKLNYKPLNTKDLDDDYQFISIYTSADEHYLPQLGKPLPFYSDRFCNTMLLLISLWNIGQTFNLKHSVKQKSKVIDELIHKHYQAADNIHRLKRLWKSYSEQNYVVNGLRQFEHIKRISLNNKVSNLPSISSLSLYGCAFDFFLFLKQLLYVIHQGNPSTRLSTFICSQLDLGQWLCIDDNASDLKDNENNTRLISMTNISSPFDQSILNVLITMTGFIVQQMIDAGEDHRLVTWLKSTPFTMQSDTNTAENNMLLRQFSNIIRQPIAHLDHDQQGYFLEIGLLYFEEQQHRIIVEANLEPLFSEQNVGVKQGIDAMSIEHLNCLYDDQFFLRKIKCYLRLPSELKRGDYHLSARYHVYLKTDEASSVTQEKASPFYNVEPLKIKI